MKLSLGLLLSLFVLPAFADLHEVIEKVYPSVAVIQTLKHIEADKYAEGFGTAIFVDKRGYFVTSLHVLDGFFDPQLSVGAGKKYAIEIVAKDEANDLALIKVDVGSGFAGKPLPPVKEFTYRLGATVITIGHPYGDFYSVSKGIISALKRKKEVNGKTFSLVQTDASINPGNSGGPIFTETGEWVGVVFGMNMIAQRIGYFVPIKPVIDFLAKNLPSAK